MVEDLYEEFRKLTPKVTGGLIRMREDTFKDTVVPAKYIRSLLPWLLLL